ncbi:MAG: GGDEF domain-containing protein, partial [Gammaproteobacteria bacterium]|nr:GGDEF domain-containing protein [Gammaproteobacteria bacterium]
MTKISRHFSIASLLGIALVTLASCFFYNQLSLNSLIEQQSQANTALTRVFSNSIWLKYAQFTQQAATLPAAEIIQHPEFQSLQQDIQQLMQGLNVVKVKLYALNGNTVYSSESQQIGMRQNNNPGFVSAKNGNTNSKLVFKDQLYSTEGIIFNKDIITSYIPVATNNDKNPQAVFELYTDVTPVLSQLETSRLNIIAAMIGLLALLYFFQNVIIKRASGRFAKKQQQQEARTLQVLYQAHHDTLTELPNRKMFLENLNQAVQRTDHSKHPFALLFIDLDRFKVVNDSLGHDVGDQLLCEASHRILEATRESDRVYRMGGDEFTVITELLHKEDDASSIAERIIKAMSRPFHLENHEIIVTTSIGIAIYPKDDIVPEKLIK